MRSHFSRVITLGFVVLLTAFGTISNAAEIWGLKPGTPRLASAGPMTFGPDGILFVGDTKAATIYAVATGDTSGDADSATINVANFHQAVADALGASVSNITVADLAVNPKTGNAIASINNDGKPALVAIQGGNVKALSLQDVKFSEVKLPNPPEDQPGRRNPRDSSITDLAYVDGKLIVSGTAKERSTNIREIGFPFESADSGSNLEIFHAAHGKTEDYARIRTFVPFMIDGEPNLLAGFVCTPLVRLPLGDLAPGEKVKGTTIAELGNRNQPYDMIVYEKDNETFLLMANSARGVMKISTKDIENNEGITEPVRGGGTAGQVFETIEELKGVVQLDRLNDTHAVVLVERDGSSDLQTVALP